MNGSQTRLRPSDESHKPGGSAYLLRWEPQIEAMRRFLALSRKYPASLAIEITTVAIGTIAAIRFLNVQPALDSKWLMIPCLLVSASLLPTWLRKGEFPPMCPTGRHIVTSLAMACGACLCTIPAVILGLWLMVRMHLPIPLRPVAAGPDGWFPWLVYQFLYVAVAEELFFRGYIQANVMRLLGDVRPGSRRIHSYLTIVISAGCFALAHVVVQGQITSLLAFFPGLILAWLFIRTHSLLAPILFHGLANVSYGVIALNLT